MPFLQLKLAPSKTVFARGLSVHLTNFAIFVAPFPVCLNFFLHEMWNIYSFFDCIKDVKIIIELYGTALAFYRKLGYAWRIQFLTWDTTWPFLGRVVPLLQVVKTKKFNIERIKTIRANWTSFPRCVGHSRTNDRTQPTWVLSGLCLFEAKQCWTVTEHTNVFLNTHTWNQNSPTRTWLMW